MFGFVLREEQLANAVSFGIVECEWEATRDSQRVQ